MARVHCTTRIDAPRERVLDLARSVDLHERSMDGHGERAVAGVTEGLLKPGDYVRFRARHFRISMDLSAEITDFDRPTHFRDEAVDAPFAEMVNDHRFEREDGETLMVDDFRFRSPLGPLGRLVDATVLERYMARLLRSRAAELNAVAEGEEWHQYLG